MSHHNRVAIDANLNERLDSDLPEDEALKLKIREFSVVAFAALAPKGDEPKPSTEIELEEGILDWLPDLAA